MAGNGYVDRDVQLAVGLRWEVPHMAAEAGTEHKVNERFLPRLLDICGNLLYIWEPTAFDAFRKFWAEPANWSRFKREFFRGEDILYRERMVGDDFHVFPAPGRVLGEDMLPDRFLDPVLARIFPPTTRAIGSTGVRSGGTLFLPTVIESISVNPDRYEPWSRGLARMKPITAVPPVGSDDWHWLARTIETRFPKVVNGVVIDEKPLAWLAYLYQLQIFLVQPCVGFRRHIRHGKHKRSGITRPAPEVVKVLMRETLPVKVPHYTFPGYHPVTGHKLEFEVDVRAHERHCASGKIARVRAHKRGPIGRTREKIIKVIR